MDTKFLETIEENIIFAGNMIKEGKLVAFPTETVYGLGGNGLNPEAVKAIYAAKGRPSDNPMILHIAEKKDILKVTGKITPLMKAVMDCFWPGPLTMIVPKLPHVPKETTGGLDTVAVRMPSNTVALKLIESSGCPVAAPSANLSGKSSPTKWEHVKEDLTGRIDAIIMGEDCKVGIESTVVEILEDKIVILRPGIVTKSQIKEAVSGLKCVVQMDPALESKAQDVGNQEISEKFLSDETLIPKAPGMKYKHYAPKGEMFIFVGNQEAVEKEIENRKVQAEKKGIKACVIDWQSKPIEEIIALFFSELRKMDEEGVELILAKGIDMTDEKGFALMNRMMKAAAYNIVQV